MPFLGKKRDPQKELQTALRAGDSARACACYEVILVQDPKNQQTRLRYADCLVQAGRKKPAVDQYVRIAREMAQGGFLIKAIAIYKKIVHLDPSKEEYHRELAEVNRAREEGRDVAATAPPAAAPPGVKPAATPAAAKPAPPAPAARPAAGKGAPAPPQPRAIPVSPDAEAEALEVETTRHAAKVAAPPPRAPETLEEAARAAAEAVEGIPAKKGPARPSRPAEVTPPETEVPEIGACDEDLLFLTPPEEPGLPAEEPGLPPEAEPIQFELGGEAPAEEPAEEAAQEVEPPMADASPVPLFSSLTTDEFAEVVSALNSYSFAPGQVILREGDEGNSLFVIVQGEVCVRTLNLEGKEIELGRLGEGDFFGEVAILTGKPRTATIIASRDTELMELTRDHVDHIAKRHPRVKEILEQFYLERVNRTIEAMVDAALGGPAGEG